jgi:ABC-type lipoprotein export system ATPase subunit
MLSLPFLKKNGNGTSSENGSNGFHPIIELKSVDKAYKTAAGDYPVLKSVDLEIGAGEFVSIIGKSGSGKTTLLNMITGIDRPSAGEVWVNGTGVHTLKEGEMARWRGRNLGIVFQFFQLLPMISVVENIMLPMDFCNTFPQAEREARALHLLDLVELKDQAYKLPTALSGGQQQRVAIARALANDPPVVIADEPTGNLDSKTAESVFDLFNNLVAQGKTIIIVTHDSGLAKQTQRTALITDGEIVNEFVARALPTLTQEQLLLATRSLQSQHYEPGAMIIQQGAEGNQFYIVAKGKVEIVLQRANASDVVVTTLEPGQYFGEMQLLHGKRRSASVRASEHESVEVLSLDYDTLRTLLDESEPTREALLRVAGQRQQENASVMGD